MSVTNVIINILPLVITIIIGYLLMRTGFLKDSYIDAFKKIVVNVTLPAGLFVAFASIDFDPKFILVFASVFTACLIMLLIGKFLAKVLKIKSPYFPFLLTGFEAGMLGYALYGGIYGLDKLSEFGIVDIGQVLFVFIVTVPLVSHMGKESEHGFFVQSFKTAVKSPVIWSIITGLIFSIAGVSGLEGTQVYSAVKGIFDFVSASTPFLIGLVIGSGLKFAFAKMKLESATALIKVVLSAAFATVIIFAVLKPLGLATMLSVPLFSMFMLPGPFIIPVFMDAKDRSEVEYVSNTLSIGTLLGLIGFIVVSFI